MKLRNLMKDLKSGKIFGKLRAVVYTIEFQKRGLPHFIISAVDNKHTHPEDIDRIISTEIPNKDKNPKLHDLVKEYMVHGPCGAADPKSPCMIDNSCSKFYPKDFSKTTYFDEDGYPLYRRKENNRFVEKSGVQLDNRYIVPYNAELLLKYESHINVEWCNQSSAIKYLFKYINKGVDQVTAVVYDENGTVKEVDEIKSYYDCRYICACEAAWRIFRFDIQYKDPAVLRLKIHLPNEQSLIYQDDDDLESVLENTCATKSMFIAGMEANEKYPGLANDLTYLEFPHHFVFKKHTCEWTPRKSGFSIGRLFHIPISCGELFYLSILVAKVSGPTTFEQIRTVNDTKYDSFRDACYALGLLDDDKEFIDCINEASLWGSGLYLRLLFVTMLLSNSIARPEHVWSKTWQHLCDDIVYQQRRILQRPDAVFSDDQIQNLGLCELEELLRRNGRSLTDFSPMPLADQEFTRGLRNILIAEQLDYDKKSLAEEFEVLANKLTEEQKKIFDIILVALCSDSGGFFFVNGYGGTGKTFLWQALTSFLRSKGEIVLTVASSGIAATLLPGGRTAHSRFAIPISLTDESTCNIRQGSPLAELMVKAKLIIWDEAPMMRKQCFEALDKSLRDILHHENPKNADLVFGGKCVVLGGDFRQILPVIPNAKRSDIVFSSINSSYLWPHCCVLTLTKNMRLQVHSNGSDINELRSFSEWILKVGDGKLSDPNDGLAEVDIPEELLIQDFDHPIEALMKATYPNFLEHYDNPNFLKEKAILALTLDVVKEVNNYLLSKIPGEEKVYLSSDSVCGGSNVVDSQSNLYSTDFLNSIKSSGLPNHELRLKIGVPIMLLRNIDQDDGLCNGTRLIISQLGHQVIEGIVITGSSFGKKLFLPRMNMCPSDTKWPFKLKGDNFQ